MTIMDACNHLHLDYPVSHDDLVRTVRAVDAAGLHTNCSDLPWWRQYGAEGDC